MTWLLFCLGLQVLSASISDASASTQPAGETGGTYSVKEDLDEGGQSKYDSTAWNSKPGDDESSEGTCESDRNSVKCSEESHTEKSPSMKNAKLDAESSINDIGEASNSNGEASNSNGEASNSNGEASNSNGEAFASTQPVGECGTFVVKGDLEVEGDSPIVEVERKLGKDREEVEEACKSSSDSVKYSEDSHPENSPSLGNAVIQEMDAIADSDKFPDVFVNDSGGEELANETAGTALPENISVIDSTLYNDLHASNESLHKDDNGGEFKCKFIWHDHQHKHLKGKVLDWMKERQKTFHRFTVPVLGYTSDLPVYGHNYTGVLTWVWLSNRQKYMIHFPHNFVVISTATMSVITQDWALDYDKSVVPPSLTLSEHSIDIKDEIYQYERNLGYCDPECLSANMSCGLGRNEMIELLTEIGDSAKNFEWDWICLQLNYDDVHSITQTGTRPNFVMPDVLYYFMFLRKLLTERPPLGLPTNKSQFLHYHCYSKENQTVTTSRELLEKYFVVPGILAIILWLYFPLLIHYFPSSSKESEHLTQDFQCPQGMFPTHKTPIYFGHCLKRLFCFYIEGNSLMIRLRRGIFLAIIFLSSFRFFYLPSWMYFACAVIALSAATLYPAHLSSYIVNVHDSNKKFALLGWDLTPGLIRVNPALKEYQLLASMMQERLYLILDRKFWSLLYEKSFDGIAQSVGALKCVGIVHGILSLLMALIVYTVYYFTPLPYFAVEISSVIFRSLSWNLISAVHCLLLFIMFAYSVVVAYFWCYAITEFSIFTLFGGVMSPSIIFPYFVLVGSLVGAIYSLIHSLHEHYNEILKAIIDILNSEKKITAAIVVEKTEDQNIPSINTVSVTTSSQKKVDLLRQTVPVTYLSKDLYNYVVDQSSPVCRYVFFIVIQVLAMLVYALIAMSTKNVFHLEEKVGTIFQLISVFAVAFVPGLLRFLAYKSHFGKKKDVVLKKKVYFAMIDYVSQLP